MMSNHNNNSNDDDQFATVVAQQNHLHHHHINETTDNDNEATTAGGVGVPIPPLNSASNSAADVDNNIDDDNDDLLKPQFTNSNVRPAAPPRDDGMPADFLLKQHQKSKAATNNNNFAQQHQTLDPDDLGRSLRDAIEHQSAALDNVYRALHQFSAASLRVSRFRELAADGAVAYSATEQQRRLSEQLKGNSFASLSCALLSNVSRCAIDDQLQRRKEVMKFLKRGLKAEEMLQLLEETNINDLPDDGDDDNDNSHDNKYRVHNNNQLLNSRKQKSNAIQRRMFTHLVASSDLALSSSLESLRDLCNDTAKHALKGQVFGSLVDEQAEQAENDGDDRIRQQRSSPDYEDSRHRNFNGGGVATTPLTRASSSRRPAPPPRHNNDDGDEGGVAAGDTLPARGILPSSSSNSNGNSNGTSAAVSTQSSPPRPQNQQHNLQALPPPPPALKNVQRSLAFGSSNNVVAAHDASYLKPNADAADDSYAEEHGTAAPSAAAVEDAADRILNGLYRGGGGGGGGGAFG